MKAIRKTTFILIVALLSVSFLVLINLSVGKYQHRGQVGRSMGKQATQAGASIEKFLSNTKYELDKLATNDLLKPGSSASGTILEDFCKKNSYFFWALITDTDGFVIASSDPDQIDEDVSDQDTFDKAIKGDIWETGMLHKDEDRSVMYFSSPIYAQGQIVGTLIAALNGESLNSILRSVKDAQIGDAIVVDDKGEVIASANESDVFKMSLADYQVGRSSLLGSRGYVLGKDAKSNSVIFGFIGVNHDMQWSVLVSSVYSDGRLAEIYGFSATIVFLLLIFSVLFSRSRFFGKAAPKVQDMSLENVAEELPAEHGSAESQSNLGVVMIPGELSVPKEIKDQGGKPTSKSYIISDQSKIVSLVDKIILEAVLDRASDIHIEPQDEGVDVRYRVDGILHLVGKVPKELQLAVISRIKIMAEMDIAEKRVPQDGRAQFKIADKDIDLRIATFPTILGEKLVLRILDRSAMTFHLQNIGLSDDNLRLFHGISRRPNALILIAGPMGSGKTTTLYATLNAIKTTERNIVTLEDPVEYRIKGINQGQISPKAGVTFARGLRSILRQDPDIIMVGEIRDVETAELAVRAALTGHLVFSTLYTMDAISTLTRLLDMGIEPFLVASSVSAVVAQRLIRTICPSCKEEYFPAKEILEIVGWQDKHQKLYHGRGCQACMHTGFKGRTALFEMLAVNQTVRELIMSKTASDVIRFSAQRAGMRTFMEDGLDKVVKGITTLEELLKTVQFDHSIKTAAGR